jgi:hypothetical protein
MEGRDRKVVLQDGTRSMEHGAWSMSDAERGQLLRIPRLIRHRHRHHTLSPVPCSDIQHSYDQKYVLEVADGLDRGIQVMTGMYLGLSVRVCWHWIASGEWTVSGHARSGPFGQDPWTHSGVHSMTSIQFNAFYPNKSSSRINGINPWV